MNKKKSAVAIVILVLLIVGGVLYQRSAERRRKAEEERQAAEQARIAREAEARRREVEVPEVAEAPGVPMPEELAPGRPAEPTGLAAPPPIAAADCKADPSPLVRKRRASAPEGMVYVAGGIFIMGSSADAGHADECPAHKVCLSGFYIDKHEVTNAQFKEFVEAAGYVTDAESDASSAGGRTWRHPYGPQSNAEDMPNHPVICVSWNDAAKYAQWAGKRLPTEAEWEKAGRGKDGRMYPWGNTGPTGELTNIADKTATLKWSDTSLDDNYEMAAPVGSFPKGKSVYGAEDMAGNVWEWCLDWWDEDYYETSPPQNPTGPQSGQFKVIRGGSWFSDTDGARTAQRMYFSPTRGSAAVGFRCAKDTG